MVNFLDVAEKIGQLLKAYDHMTTPETSDALWTRTKFHIKQHLDAAGLTPEQFDAKMKPLAGRKRITKLARMAF